MVGRPQRTWVVRSPDGVPQVSASSLSPVPRPWDGPEGGVL
jgi:hypothetical protein